MWSRNSTAVNWIVALLAVIGLVGFIFGPINMGLEEGRESAAMQTTSTLALAMFQYANDHDGKYPIGQSSTEVFQKLIDGNYVSDASIFYVAMPGKKKATSDKLKPENVSFDVTVPVDSHSPDELPLVFLTGYRIEYKAGASAVPLPGSATPFDGLAVCYKSNSAIFREPKAPKGWSKKPNHMIENFVPLDFDSKGQKFQQLTPDGSLPAQ